MPWRGGPGGSRGVRGTGKKRDFRPWVVGAAGE